MARRKKLKDCSVIQLDEWGNWRIVGDGVSWQLQQSNDGIWNARQTYPSLLSAALAAYDYALMGMGFKVDSVRELCELCESAIQRLTDEIRKAVSQ